jgi:hypothetical protein
VARAASRGADVEVVSVTSVQPVTVCGTRVGFSSRIQLDAADPADEERDSLAFADGDHLVRVGAGCAQAGQRLLVREPSS